MTYFPKTTEEIKKAAQAVGNAAVDGAKAFGGAVVDAAKWGIDAAVDTGKAVRRSVQAVGRTVKDSVVYVYDQSRKTFTAVKVGATLVLCEAARKAKFIGVAAINEMLNGIMAGGAYVLSDPDSEKFLRALNKLFPPKPKNNPIKDGDNINNANCCKFYTNTCDSSGVMPENCRQSSGVLPKAQYINGINTDLAGHCATLKKLATALCKEVTGIFNDTYGLPRDVVECLDNIQRTGSPASEKLKNEILAKVRSEPPQSMELYAHSQGGLATQDALVAAKSELLGDYAAAHYPRHRPTKEEAAAAESYAMGRLENIKVSSFGTALIGWPTGPQYENYTNVADPVPRVIFSAQMNNIYKTINQTQGISPTLFYEPHVDPFKSHSMDDTYIPKMMAIRQSPACMCK
jgi:hypothetical protein